MSTKPDGKRRAFYPIFQSCSVYHTVEKSRGVPMSALSRSFKYSLLFLCLLSLHSLSCSSKLAANSCCPDYFPSESESPCEVETSCCEIKKLSECCDWLDCCIPGEFSTCVTFLSQYRFRGVTQSDEDAAIQGSIDYCHDCGLYIGVWGSNVDFNDEDEAHMELDIYAGFVYCYDCFELDLGVIGYFYPGSASSLDYDYIELMMALTYSFRELFSLTGSLNYSPDNFGSSGHALYSKVAVEVPLICNFALCGHMGYQSIEDNDVFGLPDYYDWGAALSFRIQCLTLKLEYVDTDLSTAESASGSDAALIFSVSCCI